MSTRLADGGRLIDRSRKVEFTFNGKRFSGHPGRHAGLRAHGQWSADRGPILQVSPPARHRGLRRGGAQRPGQSGAGRPARTQPARHHDRALRRADRHLPEITGRASKWDIGEANAAIARFPAGGVLLQDLHPSRAAFWKHVFEPFIRQSAGLGQGARSETHRPRPLRAILRPCGRGRGRRRDRRASGGTRGRAAPGRRSCYANRPPHWGGRAPVDGVEIDGRPARGLDRGRRGRTGGDGECPPAPPAPWSRASTTTATCWPMERVSDHAPQDGVPRHRLWRIRTGQVISAIGRDRAPAQLRRQRQAGRDAGLGGARLPRGVWREPPATGRSS